MDRAAFKPSSQDCTLFLAFEAHGAISLLGIRATEIPVVAPLMNSFRGISCVKREADHGEPTFIRLLDSLPRLRQTKAKLRNS